MCNEAFDELLTQEFNPDQDDFKDDPGTEIDTKKDAGELLFIFLYIFIPGSFTVAV